VRNLRIREDTAKVFNVWFLKISIPPPQRVIGYSEEEGVLKAKIFKGKYEPKLEFPEGWGFKPKKPFVGGNMDIFGTTQFMDSGSPKGLI